MAWSTCPKCDSHKFDYVENSPDGSAYKLMFVQCSSCGAVVGVMDYLSIGTQNEQLKEEIKVLTKEVERSQYTLNHIVNLLNQIINNGLEK